LPAHLDRRGDWKWMSREGNGGQTENELLGERRKKDISIKKNEGGGESRLIGGEKHRKESIKKEK